MMDSYLTVSGDLKKEFEEFCNGVCKHEATDAANTVTQTCMALLTIVCC